MMIRLEPAAEHDLSLILELPRAFYGQAVLYNDFTLPALVQTLAELTAEFGRLRLCKVEVKGRIVASVRGRREERTLQVEKLMVAPEVQNQGIGARMLHELESRYAGAVDRYALCTGNKSARNLHLYKKCGYREIGRKPLSDRWTLVVLEKQVADTSA